MDGDFLWICDKYFVFFNVCGVEIYQNVDYKKNIYYKVSVEKWV